MSEKGTLLKKKYPMPTLLKIVATATLSCFVSGYNIGVTNSSLDNVEKFLGSNISSTVFSAIQGAIFALGGTIGSLSSGKLANYYGRRKGMMILCFLTFLTCGIVINI
jgi:MFS family permease